MRFTLFLAISFSFLNLNAQTPLNLVPMPAEISEGKGIFRLDANTIIVQQGIKVENSANFLRDYIAAHYGLMLNTGKHCKDKNLIILNYQKSGNRLPGAYSMQITGKEIRISGDQEAVFYGIQTLLQLLPLEKAAVLNIPQLYITDYPRFGYRGMHLDVGRHLFPVEYIKKYIDYLALHKFNNFHWHLTEDQGWRIEIKRYPKLTEVGSCRNQTLVGRYGSDKYDSTAYCGFYTQEEIKDIVKYAANRFINIIPEIDMPGHTLAALTSYPFLGCTKGPYKVMETWGVAPDVLCAGNDSSYTFMENVLDEVMQLFPSQYIHIGGDESPKERWKTCQVCQQRIKTEHLKNEHELQSYFTQRIEKYVNSKGRKIIGWDEILEGGLAPNAAVMSWRGEAGGIAAAKQKHYVVMTPESPLYLNHSQTRNEDSVTQGGYNPIENVYAYDPIPKELNEQQAAYILGAQGNLWTEYIDNERKLEYMLFPRIAALSEVLWSTKKQRSWNSFEKRLPGIMERYKFLGINFSTAYFDLQPAVVPNSKDGIAWKLESKSASGKIFYTRDSTGKEKNNYSVPVTIDKAGLYGAALFNDQDNVISPWIWQRFTLNKASGKKISLLNEPNKSYSLGGAFALVDGVQNDRGMLRSTQFLGFNGKDLEAVIDLGVPDSVKIIRLHAFEQKGSWIYRPASVSFYYSTNGKDFLFLRKDESPSGNKNLLYEALTTIKARYIKVVAKNKGTIGPGEPGAGNKAWLFADEIEVN